MHKLEDSEIAKALNTLDMVQGLLIRNKGIKNLVLPDATSLNKKIHIIALCIAIILILIEIFYDSMNTNLLLLSNFNQNILAFNIINIALGLSILTISLHFLIIQRAKKLSADYNDYINEHFQYLSNFSFLTDLFVKFIIVTIVIIAKKPEWVAPVLSLFIGDYLFQGRFFVFPIVSAYILGISCWIVASSQVILGSPSLIWSLLLFSAVCLMSLFNLTKFSQTK